MGTKLDTALGDYLREIKQYDLLTADEERELARRIRTATECEERFANGGLTLREREEIELGAAEARDILIQANLRLVVSAAKHFRNRGLPMEDLVNEGNVGLVNAVDRFDPDVGSRFSTYASYWIEQAIRRALQNATQIIHIPAYLMEQIGHMKCSQRELEKTLSRSPTLAEIAEHMGISPRKARVLADAIKACAAPLSGITPDGSSLISETIADTRSPAPTEGVYSESDSDFVTKLLEVITEREATVLRLRYGLRPGGKRMTLKEIGREVGLTRERVRQIETEAKRKLIEYVKSYL
ncbi:MAG: RNA polymerase principal sigma factor HrdB [Phycisphaerae bacterium]|nr:RNA polymerase principal sigma factor HrdB [Phycisphaerae bacterium]